MVAGDAYPGYPAVATENASVALQLLHAGMSRLAAKHGKPVLLQESGHPTLEGSAELFASVFETFAHEPWWAGVLFWKWNTNPDMAGNAYCRTGPQSQLWPIHRAPAQ